MQKEMYAIYSFIRNEECQNDLTYLTIGKYTKKKRINELLDFSSEKLDLRSDQ